MKVFHDIFNNEEILSDSFMINEKFEGVCGEVKSKMIKKGGDEDIDIGCGNAFGGTNEPEEGEEAEAGGAQSGSSSVVKEVDLIVAFKYQETSFQKSEYVPYIKAYMQKIIKHLNETNPARVADFKKGAAEMVKYVLANFNDFSFYCPESYDQENIIIMSQFVGEETAPTFWFFMDGLKGVNC